MTAISRVNVAANKLKGPRTSPITTAAAKPSSASQKTRRVYDASFKLMVVEQALRLPPEKRIKPTCRAYPGLEPVCLPFTRRAITPPAFAPNVLVPSCANTPHVPHRLLPSQVQIRKWIRNYEALRTAQLDDKHASKRPVLKQNTTRPSSPALSEVTETESGRYDHSKTSSRATSPHTQRTWAPVATPSLPVDNCEDVRAAEDLLLLLAGGSMSS